MKIGNDAWNKVNGVPVALQEIQQFEDGLIRSVLTALVRRDLDTAQNARDFMKDDVPHDPYRERFHAGRADACKRMLGILETLPAQLKEAYIQCQMKP